MPHGLFVKENYNIVKYTRRAEIPQPPDEAKRKQQRVKFRHKFPDHQF
jgi:hypothetical protein